MFENDGKKDEKVKKIVNALSDHEETKTHSRHISMQQCKDLGLKIVELESDQEMQDIILSIHHSYMHTMSNISGIMKIVENQNGIRVIESGVS